MLDGLKTAALFGDKCNVPSAELNIHRIPVLEKKEKNFKNTHDVPKILKLNC